MNRYVQPLASVVNWKGNPLADIHNTRTVDRVGLKGVSYHPAEFRLE